MSSSTRTSKLLHYGTPTRARPLLAPARGGRHCGGLEEARTGGGRHVHHDWGQNVRRCQTRAAVHQCVEVQLVHDVGRCLNRNVETAEAVGTVADEKA